VTITIPSSNEPLVSVVMVLYGGWTIARRAILTLADNTDRTFELVLVENGSPDDTAARAEKEVVGARLIVNETNRGFGVASNQGAKQARAPYLCFLNSDAFVQPGWLEPLLETFETDPSVGELLLTSILKGIDVGVIDAVKQASTGDFDATPFIGTLENDGVGLAPFHDFESKVSPDLQGELDAIKAGIIDGSIPVKSYLAS
jgi:glycosyltransferase involved in cell wall biosynthesis